jgi:ribosomal protein S18 acetylase RimI-like enzyme
MSLHIRPYRGDDEAAVIALWQAAKLTRPWNDPRRDIARKLCVQPDLFLVGELDGTIVASVMAGYEGHRGWVNYLAVAPEHQRRGYATRLMEQIELRLRAAGCPKLNLQLRVDNIAALGFYDRLGYVQDQVLSLGKRLERDERPEPPVLPPAST